MSAIASFVTSPILAFFENLRESDRIDSQRREITWINSEVDDLLDETGIAHLATTYDDRSRQLVFGQIMAQRENLHWRVMVDHERYGRRYDEDPVRVAREYALDRMNTVVLPQYRNIFPDFPR